MDRQKPQGNLRASSKDIRTDAKCWCMQAKFFIFWRIVFIRNDRKIAKDRRGKNGSFDSTKSNQTCYKHNRME